MTSENKNLDYQKLIKEQPWIIQRNQNCIVSPDSDGLLCGLFMSSYLDWKIAGFYDGKVLVVKKNTKPKNCVFLDMEIFRNGVKSVGHHMLSYNNKHLPNNWEQLKNCISANNLRNFDMKHNFPANIRWEQSIYCLALSGRPKKSICRLIRFALYYTRMELLRICLIIQIIAWTGLISSELI